MSKKLSIFRWGQILRPLALLMVPGVVVLGFGYQSFLGVLVWMLIQQPVIWLLRCKNCGTNIYFDKQHPWKTLLAKPHRDCTDCGTSFETSA